jgi:SAM-dependent methyltransferase
MKSTLPCILCGSQAESFAQAHDRHYFSCPACGAIILDPEQYVPRDDEVYRYETHNNDVEDPRYQAFVRPLVESVKTRYEPGSHGLDYGSGTGPVAAKMLRDAGYHITTYDPFFDKNPEAMRQSYDFIISSEVVEHFHQPAKEFRLLKALLQPGGHLHCYTLRYHRDIDFEKWHYVHDETHVIFYRDETARWIGEAFGFSDVLFEERLFILQK